MFNLQLLNSQQHLLYLVRLSLSLMILYVDPWISLAWRLVNMVTSVFLSCLTERINTDVAQVRKSNIRWIDFHPYKDIFDLGHGLHGINIDIYVKPFFAGCRGCRDKTTPPLSDIGGVKKFHAYH
jgi:hypothetical protein